MPWLRIDDKFWRNQKMRKVSHAARGVWLDSASYCADTPEPTGFLTETEARERATGSRRLIAELVREHAFEVVNGGYLIHDFEKYLDKGSRDRCRAWRERKRNESETSPVTATQRHPNVTDPSPRATGLETTSTPWRVPVPVPEPGPAPNVTAVSKPPTNGAGQAARFKQLATSLQAAKDS